jgi:TctA family transporter
MFLFFFLKKIVPKDTSRWVEEDKREMGEDWAGGRGRQALALATACAAACICGLIATRQLAVCAPPCLAQRYCIWHFTLPCWGKYQCSYIAGSVLPAAAACFLENAAAYVGVLGRGKHP